jgi:hypothetical protein
VREIVIKVRSFAMSKLWFVGSPRLCTERVKRLAGIRYYIPGTYHAAFVCKPAALAISGNRVYDAGGSQVLFHYTISLDIS